MKANNMKMAWACIAAVALGMATHTADAQCTTCAVPQVTYSPVVYQTTYDGWYLGKYLGRMTRNLFGPAPAPATYATYGYQAPTTYAASYAPAVTYGAAYAPSCSTCCSSPCSCQTTYRPVIMQPVGGCSTCGSYSSCSGVVQAGYDAPAVSSCPSCETGTSTITSSNPAPALGTAGPPPTFREADKIEPTPADEAATESSASDFNAPLLLNPNDQITKRPTAPVWTAVYKQPAMISTAAAVEKSQPTSKPTVRWTAGR